MSQSCGLTGMFKWRLHADAYHFKIVKPEINEKCWSRVATGRSCSITILVSSSTLPVPLIYLFAAFLNDPGELVGLCGAQATCGTPQSGFALLLASRVEPM